MKDSRIVKIYNAIKNTRRMSRYWINNPESFIKWYKTFSMGENMTVYSESGYYSAKDCKLCKVGSVDRKSEKRNMSKGVIDIKKIAGEMLCSLGADSKSVSSLFNINLNVFTKNKNSIDKNKEIISYVESYKSTTDKRSDIIKLCKNSGIDIYDGYYNDIMSSDESLICKIHEELFGNIDDKIYPVNREISSRLKGTIAIMKAIERCLINGFIVSRPVIEGCKYDLVIDDGTSIKRVIVRYSSSMTKNNNIIIFPLTRIAGNGDKIRYEKRDADIFMLYCPITDSVYKIDNVGNMGHVSISIKDRPEFSDNIYYGNDFKF